MACNAISACPATCNIPEPAIRFAIMRAAAAAGKLSAGNDAQVLLGLCRTVVSKVHAGGIA
jgi:hypothetical protein